MKYVYVFFAEGFEEIEALTVVDLLRRADIGVKMVALGREESVTGSHGIRVQMDTSLKQVSLTDAKLLVLPGGMPGTKNLGACGELTAMLREADRQKIMIAAICAAPLVLGDLGILDGKRAVCYPGHEARLTGAQICREAVVVDGHITTSRGMGTAIDFGLSLVEQISGREESERIRKAIIYGNLS